MKVIKELRKVRNISIDQLAKMVSVSSADLTEWENDIDKFPSKILSHISIIFGTSSKSLKEIKLEEGELINTNHYFLYTNKKVEDGWWGHIGILLEGEITTRWYPISLNTYKRAWSVIANLDEENEVLEIKTLNNRNLLFFPAKTKKIVFLDEAVDEPNGDWKLKHDEISGMPEEFYHGLNEYLDGLMFLENTSFCKKVQEMVEEYTDKYDMDENKIVHYLEFTKIFCADGSKYNMYIESQKLADMTYFGGLEGLPLIVDLSDDGYDLFIPRKNIVLIDMPYLVVEKGSEILHQEMMN